MMDDPEVVYDPDGSKRVYFALNVPPPPNAPPTHWGIVYDMRAPDWTTGDDSFLVTCRDALLVERCVKSLHQDDLVCIEGRLVLTYLRSDRDLVPLAEIFASDVILLQTTPKES
jgi:hypothetical protein